MDPAVELEMAALPKLRAINDAIAIGDSEIQRFYKNSIVFVTGGSGFLGKQLLEKLIRSCKISKVYMLLRSKKGNNIQQRLEIILKEPVFDTLRKQQPDFETKIVAVPGDVAEIKLGLKDADWKTLTEEVDVIFHVAATTKFDETIRDATLINIRGTREVLTLGKDCKKLKTYVHVSTAYSQATTVLIGQEVEEEFYKSPIPPETMISMVETMEENRLQNITAGLISSWPNTYVFTKAVAEDLVRTNSADLPICIVRPAIVLCSYNEPSPGWIDISCIYGASGLMYGIGLGLLHTVYAKVHNVTGLIPCDFVNNAILAAGKETATNQSKGGNDTRIYTVSSTKRNPVTWNYIENITRNEGLTVQSPALLYYQYGVGTSSKLLFMILSLFLHIIPAYIADFVCLLLGKERRAVKMAKKVYNMCNTLSYFLVNEWQLADDNLENLYSNLSQRDKVIFNFDIPNIHWTEYILLWFIGIRKYIVKDGLKGTKYAIKKQQFLKIAHYIFMTVYSYVIWKLAYFAYYVVSSLYSYLINFF